MHRIILFLCTLILAGGCYSDNAAPETHGAHNKPSQGGATTTPAEPQMNRDQTSTAPSPTAGQTTTTYGGEASGGAAGGTPTSTH